MARVHINKLDKDRAVGPGRVHPLVREDLAGVAVRPLSVML